MKPTTNISPEGEKLFKGAQLAIQRAIEQAKLTNRELAVFRDGKVVRIKARDL